MKRMILAALVAAFALGGLTTTFAQRTTTRTARTTTTITKTTTTTTIRPVYANDTRDTLEMVFVLDTTGSMGGLIDGAKQRIWGIINEVMQKPSKPRVRVGLVAYRDIGDEYVTKLLPITEDLDKAYTTLMDYRAQGGGDTPENVRKALAEGVRDADGLNLDAAWPRSSFSSATLLRRTTSKSPMCSSPRPKPSAGT